MRMSINHKTGFRYQSPVASSYNEARMVPVTTDTQTVWSSRVTIDPVPWSFSYTDYWGTLVTTFELHEPHNRRADSTIESMLSTRNSAQTATRTVTMTNATPAATGDKI
jgi:transglutaminase-like putative cysteine protease